MSGNQRIYSINEKWSEATQSTGCSKADPQINKHTDRGDYNTGKGKRVLNGFQFYLHTHTFIRNRNEPYLPLPSQPQLALIYRPVGMEGWVDLGAK